MAQKFFALNGKATAKDGKERFVTVVGEYKQVKETIEQAFVAQCDCASNKESVVIVPTTTKKRNFTMAYAICNPEDEFSEEVGKAVAKSRLKRDPIGVLTSTHCTMLNDDQCELLLFGELHYILDNIDKYLPETSE